MIVHGPLLLLFVLLISCAMTASGQQPISPSPRPAAGKDPSTRTAPATQRRPAALKALILDAQSAPAEFAADALIRLAESPQVTDREWKRELLEEAFRRSSDAQYPVRRSYIGGDVDTRSGYLSYAFDLRSDVLSLQSRVIRAMLSVDRKSARALISEVAPKLKLPPLSCEEALAYNVADFYQLLPEIVQTAFSPEEIRQNQHIELLARYVEGLTSPAQVGPVVRAIIAVKPSASQLTILVHTFSHALKEMAADDRSFEYARLKDGVDRRIAELAEACQQKEVSKKGLLEAYRAYLVRSLSGSRCADNVRKNGYSLTEAKALADLNQLLKLETPITAEETQPQKVEGSAQRVEYWRTPEARDLLMKAKRLRFGSGSTPLTAAEKERPEWQIELAEFLDALALWEGAEEESEADYFHQKSILYAGVLELTPAGETRDEVMRGFVTYLREHYVQRESRIEWLWQASHLLRMAGTAPHEERVKILEMLSHSGDATLRLYGEIEKMAPPVQESAR